MTTRRRQQFVAGQVVWLLATIVVFEPVHGDSIQPGIASSLRPVNPP